MAWTCWSPASCRVRAGARRPPPGVSPRRWPCTAGLAGSRNASGTTCRRASSDLPRSASVEEGEESRFHADPRRRAFGGHVDRIVQRLGVPGRVAVETLEDDQLVRREVGEVVPALRGIEPHELRFELITGLVVGRAHRGVEDDAVAGFD